MGPLGQVLFGNAARPAAPCAGSPIFNVGEVGSIATVASNDAEERILPALDPVRDDNFSMRGGPGWPFEER